MNAMVWDVVHVHVVHRIRARAWHDMSCKCMALQVHFVHMHGVCMSHVGMCVAWHGMCMRVVWYVHVVQLSCACRVVHVHVHVRGIAWHVHVHAVHVSCTCMSCTCTCRACT